MKTCDHSHHVILSSNDLPFGHEGEFSFMDGEATVGTIRITHIEGQRFGTLKASGDVSGDLDEVLRLTSGECRKITRKDVAYPKFINHLEMLFARAFRQPEATEDPF